MDDSGTQEDSKDNGHHGGFTLRLRSCFGMLRSSRIYREPSRNSVNRIQTETYATETVNQWDRLMYAQRVIQPES